MAVLEADAELEALLRENASLQAENDALRKDTSEYGIAADDLPVGVPSSDAAATSQAGQQARLDALRREREALLGVLRLGEELQELRQANCSLRDTARQLYAENASLRDENSSLREGPRSPAFSQISAEIRAQATGQPVPTPGTPHAAAVGTDLERKAMDIAEAIRNGNSELIGQVSCSPEKRKELVAAMLKAGIYDSTPKVQPQTPPVVPAKRQAPAPAPPAAPPPRAAAHLGTSGSLEADEWAAATGPKKKLAPAHSFQDPAPPLAPAAAWQEQTLSAPAPRAMQVPAPPAASSVPAGMAHGSGSRSSPALPAHGQGTRTKPLPPLRHGQDVNKITEALQQGNSEALTSMGDKQRKELIAEMLKAGLQAEGPKNTVGISSGDPTSFRAADLSPQEDDCMDYSREQQVKAALLGLKETSAVDRAPAVQSLAAAPAPPSHDDGSTYTRELAVKQMLQGLAGAR